MSDAVRQLCTFTVGGLRLGLPVEDVQEVLRQTDVTPVPRAPRAVRGLVNLRGQIVAAVDLRRRLGLPDRAAADEWSNVVVRTSAGPTALIVDDIGDVVVSGDMEPPPETLARHLRELAVGVHESEEGLLLVLAAARAAGVEAAADASAAPS